MDDAIRCAPALAILVSFLLLLGLPGQLGKEEAVAAPSAILGQRRQLDRTIQQEAFEAFDHHKTGEIYSVSFIEGNDSLVKAIRVRTGSLRRRGLKLEEFFIPSRCLLTPSKELERIVLVYQHLGKSMWPLFSPYLTRNGYELSSPVVAMFAYDASDLSTRRATPKLSLVSSQQNITVRMKPTSLSSSSMPLPRCVRFADDEISITLTKLDNRTGSCISDRLGLFALVSPILTSSPLPKTAPPSIILNPGPDHRKAWKIAIASVAIGFAVLTITSLAVVGYIRYRRGLWIVAMEEKAEREEEDLQMASVGLGCRTPAAGCIRTKPVLEREHPS